jgi:predicted nucleic acid-binding protein
MPVKKIIVDSDIILDHVLTKKPISLLRKLHQQYFCYTTAFNAIEVFSAARTKREIQAVQYAMNAMKILGLNAKSAKNIAGVFSGFRNAKKSNLCSLIAGIALESKLPIVTMHPNRFLAVKNLKIIAVKNDRVMKR